MRLLHTMIRVGDLDRSIGFYTGILGMKLLRRKDYPDGKFTLAFVGYGDESETAVIELTHNWDTKSYDLGNGFGHLAVAVEDAYKACEAVKARGGKVPGEAGPRKFGGGVNAPGGTCRRSDIAKRYWSITERRPYCAVPGFATMRSTTSFCSRNTQSRTRAATAATRKRIGVETL